MLRTRATPRESPTITRLPSGLNENAVSDVWWANTRRSGAVPEAHSRAVPSSLEVRTALPFGLNATELIAPACPARTATGFPFVSQVRALSSRLPVTMAVPGRLKATDVVGFEWPNITPICCPVVGSQTRAVPSLTAAATSFPRGLNTPSTIALPNCGPRSRCKGRPVVADQTRATPSCPQVMRSAPSGLKATQWIRPFCCNRRMRSPLRNEGASGMSRTNERGQAVVLMVISLAVLTGMAALVLDVGIWMRTDRRLQATADAAALAGAQKLPTDVAGAKSLAQTYANQNGGDVLGANISVTSTYTSNDTISVKAAKNQSGVFSKILGINSANIKADAKARTDSPAQARYVAPMVVYC